MKIIKVNRITYEEIERIMKALNYPIMSKFNFFDLLSYKQRRILNTPFSVELNTYGDSILLYYDNLPIKEDYNLYIQDEKLIKISDSFKFKIF